MTIEYAEPIRYTTETHTVPFTREGMTGKWARWRKNKVAAAERQRAAVTEAHQSARKPAQPKENA